MKMETAFLLGKVATKIIYKEVVKRILSVSFTNRSYLFILDKI